MKELSAHIPLDHILLDAECRSKKRIFEQVSIVFENTSGAAREKIFRALINRERLGSTALGNGGAVPHGKMDDLGAPLCALVRLKEPMQYEAAGDNGMVQTLFFVIAPAAANGDGEAPQGLLDRFSALLSDKSFTAALGECDTPEEARRVIDGGR